MFGAICKIILKLTGITYGKRLKLKGLPVIFNA